MPLVLNYVIPFATLNKLVQLKPNLICMHFQLVGNTDSHVFFKTFELLSRLPLSLTTGGECVWLIDSVYGSVFSLIMRR